MLKTQLDPLTLQASSATTVAQGQPRRRLVVLFPAQAPENPGLAHQIWETARSFRMDVLLLGLFRDYDEDCMLRRKLATLAALIRDDSFSAEIRIERGDNWVRKAKSIWRPGDLLTCFAGQRVGVRRKPLAQALEASLPTRVQVLSAALPAESVWSRLLLQVYFWGGLGLIMGTSLWIGIKLVQLPSDWAHSALLYLSILLEFVLVWAWNSIF